MLKRPLSKRRISKYSTKDILTDIEDSKQVTSETLKIKNLEEYTPTPDYKTTRGRTRGTWMHREKKSDVKHSNWLFKGGGGRGNLPRLAAGELHAIREAYAGEIYELYIPEHTPKTRLAINNKSEKNHDWKYYLGSKEIKNLTFLPPEKINHKLFIQNKKKEVAKVFILSMILGEIDFSFSNCGLSQNNLFIKIDHGESLDLNPNGTDFTRKLDVDKLFEATYWSAASNHYLSKDYFSEEIITESLKEILGVDINNLIKVANKYETLISDYRNKFKENCYYLIGNKENKIKDILISRLNNLRLSYDAHCTETKSPTTISPR